MNSKLKFQFSHKCTHTSQCDLIPFPLVVATNFFTAAERVHKTSDGFSNQIFTGVMTFVMGIVTMVRMTRNMPKRLTDSTFYSNSMYGDEMIKGQGHQYRTPDTAISSEDYFIMMKRMNELEERVSILTKKPPSMPTEKEEMLNNALNRIGTLEQELSGTKKVFPHSSHMSIICIPLFLVCLSPCEYEVVD